jgi:hypothetical protein
MNGDGREVRGRSCDDVIRRYDSTAIAALQKSIRRSSFVDTVQIKIPNFPPESPVRRLLRPLLRFCVPVIVGLAALAACEDDPILAPDKGSKQSNGSYGNIAVAPPTDTTDVSEPRTARPNPELY